MANDGYVQPPADTGVGKKVDTTELTRPDGAVIERQRVAIPGTVLVDGEIERQILIELRLLSMLFASAFNIQDDLERLRGDISIETEIDVIERRQADFS